MLKRELIIPADMRNLYDQRGYTPGVKVGNILHVSGMLGRDENLNIIAEPEAQFERIFENTKAVLEAAGTSFDHAIELVGYFTNLQRDMAIYQKIKDRYVTRDFPAQTLIGIAELSTPGLFCELKTTALVPG